MPLTWTPAPPTQPGWYWFRRHRREEPCVGCVFETDQELWFEADDGLYGRVSMLIKDHQRCAWAGPVEPPQEPAGEALP